MTNQIIIGVGTNIEPQKHIDMVLKIFHEEFEVIQIASWLNTAPVGIIDQPHYVNGAILIATELDSIALKFKLIEIEDRCGRVRSGPKFGPRTMDLDILTWNLEVVDKDVYDRDFLQISIQELSPEINIKKEI